MTRKIKRTIARINMEKVGIFKYNKKKSDGKSYFSQYWRKYVTRQGG